MIQQPNLLEAILKNWRALGVHFDSKLKFDTYK